MPSSHAPCHHPASPADDAAASEISEAHTIQSPANWVWTSIFDPTVHTALRPIFTRALFGGDDDCTEILEAFCSPGMEAVIVKDPPCTHCAVLGRTCIAATKRILMWPTTLWAHATRCVTCVLHGQTCDMPVETRLLTCNCHWMVPANDMLILAQYVRLHFFRVTQLCLPIARRTHPRILALLISKLQVYREWFNEHAEMGYEMHLPDLLPALNALGTSHIARDDGQWIVEARARWEPCPCYPFACDEGVHPFSEGCCHWDEDEFEVLGDELLGFAEGDTSVASGLPMFEESPIAARGRGHEAVAARRLSVLDRLDGRGAGGAGGGAADQCDVDVDQDDGQLEEQEEADLELHSEPSDVCLDPPSPESADRGLPRSVSI